MRNESFYSTLVRLKVNYGYKEGFSYSSFLFHIGAIKSSMTRQRALLTIELFLFHIGAIKSGRAWKNLTEED